MNFRSSIVVCAKITFWGVGIETPILLLIILMRPDIIPWNEIPWIISLLLLLYISHSFYIGFCVAVTDIELLGNTIQFRYLFKKKTINVNDIVSVDSCYHWLYFCSPYIYLPLMIYHNNGRVLLLYRFYNFTDIVKEIKERNIAVKSRIFLPDPLFE